MFGDLGRRFSLAAFPRVILATIESFDDVGPPRPRLLEHREPFARRCRGIVIRSEMCDTSHQRFAQWRVTADHPASGTFRALNALEPTICRRRDAKSPQLRDVCLPPMSSTAISLKKRRSAMPVLFAFQPSKDNSAKNRMDRSSRLSGDDVGNQMISASPAASPKKLPVSGSKTRRQTLSEWTTVRKLVG